MKQVEEAQKAGKDVKPLVKHADAKAATAVSQLKKIVENVHSLEAKVLPLKSHQCFYIHSLGKDGFHDTNIVLEVLTKDKYAPKSTGVFDVRLSKKDRKKATYKAQQWYYDSSDNTVHSKMFPNKVLLEGKNKNLVVYKNRQMGQQKFFFDEVDKEWANSITKNALSVDGKVVDNGNVKTADFKDLLTQRWRIVYCDEEDE